MDERFRQTISEINKAIHSAERIALFCHIRPDGDAVGSMLSLGWALESIGKNVQYIVPDDLPIQGMLTPEKLGRKTTIQRQPEAFDCSILLDISSLDRAGEFFNQPDSPRPDICIDHHISNPGIARINLIDSTAPATAMIIALLIPELGLSISSDIANALISGIVMDTQGFATSNTTAKALRVTADLMDNGADLYACMQEVLLGHTFEAAKFWAYGLNNLAQKDGILWSYLTSKNRSDAGYLGQDDGGLIDYMAATENTKVTILFYEKTSARIKVSWRSKPGIDVAKIAAKFGGGGHLQAAGAEISGRLDDVIQEVLAVTQQAVA